MEGSEDDVTRPPEPERCDREIECRSSGQSNSSNLALRQDSDGDQRLYDGQQRQENVQIRENDASPEPSIYVKQNVLGDFGVYGLVSRP